MSYEFVKAELKSKGSVHSMNEQNLAVKLDQLTFA